MGGARQLTNPQLSYAAWMFPSLAGGGASAQKYSYGGSK